ncbi:Multidrug efflux pump subunit AcrB [Natronincola peptidivorans]|uniref:Multidrug efflux pump subunit AcrB n=1 Tax=Natronincola peptidivorans TaxID=426128 RepID=A0A1I0C821_9FIRM|nr:efflux RND transporter permease subunit [Natronincola peptidivorans]SET15093.1 Multidrug efflux pump subunit AcrB [Natronincola peptidivorans]
MAKFIKLFIEKRKITLFLAVVIAFYGSISYYLLPKQESPDVSEPAAMIITVYPGASPADVKDLVTKKIEDKLAELEGFDKSYGLSNEGLSVVTVVFHNYVDTNIALQNVRNAVADVQSELPNGCLPSEVNTDLIKAAGIIISLSGENYTYEQLDSFGKLFKDKLVNIKGISEFNVEGKLKKEVKVEVDIAKLNQLDISIADINEILQAQNVQIPSGSIRYEDAKITVMTPGTYSSLEEIRDTIISVSPETGSVTKLSDVAKIYMDLEENVTKFKQNGRNAVLLTGYFQKGKNVMIVGKDVRKAIDEVKATLPEDLMVEEVIYQPDDIAESINTFMKSLIAGMILVIIVVFGGMGLRNALVVSMVIPLSILITFGIMYVMKVDIHQISLTGLIIALGMLVDNAIVISDNIQVRIDQGVERAEAAYKGAASMSIPILAATLTTIAAFAPLLGIPGPSGDFLEAIPIILIISILSAYSVAMFITPAMATTFFKKGKTEKKKESIFRKFFCNTLMAALKRRKVVLGITMAVFIGTLTFIIPALDPQFFPYTDKNLFYIDIVSEAPDDIEATERLTDEIVKLLYREPEITSYTVAVGTGLPKFHITMWPATPSPDFAQLVAKFDLGDKKARRFNSNTDFIDYIQRKLNENIPYGRGTVKLLEYAEPFEARVILMISGENYDRLREVSDLLKEEVSKIPGTVNVRHNAKDETLQLEIKVDKDKASSFGISQYDLQSQVHIALFGSNASVYRREGNEYNILLKSSINDVQLLENLEIKSSFTGNKVPIKQFAAVEFNRRVNGIYTYRGVQTIELLVNELSGYSPVAIANTIEDEILPTLDTSGTTISFEGEREEIDENFSILGILALFSIFAMYIILLIQFHSFIQPLIILLTVPLSIIGSALGLFLLRNPLSFTAFLGIIALAGIVVNNGILIIEYINDARKEGYTIEEACLDAIDKRLNAIILTATTTVMGLTPLALSGSSLFSPMAIALMFGLIVSTFLTMIIIPVVYSLIEDLKEKLKKHKDRIIT